MIAEIVMAWLYGRRAVARRWDLSYWRIHRSDAALVGIEISE